MQSLTIRGLLINYTYNRKYTHICLLVPYLQRVNGHFLKLYMNHHDYFLSNTLKNVLLSEMFSDMQLLQLNFYDEIPLHILLSMLSVEHFQVVVSKYQGGVCIFT